MNGDRVDPRALIASGQQALQAGEPARALELLQKAVDASPRPEPGLWLSIATANRALDDDEGEMAAIEKALALDPRSLVALLLKAANYERRGDLRAAGSAFGSALQVAPPFGSLPGELQQAMRHAVDVAKAYAAEREAFLRDFLAGTIEDLKGEKISRFEESFDISLGRKSVYRQQPHVLYFPGLPTIQFFDRDLFPWWPEVEAATRDIHDELIAVLEQDEGMVPYIQYPAGKPLDQWAELNHSPKWSAFHFSYMGESNEENRARAPKTVAALKSVPQPDMPKLAPVSLYSILKPRTRIPPHTGVTNARLVCHLPIIVPEKCWFRVGNDTREWTVGQGLVFDDSIEHEAANDSDKVRAVLIFDVWNPYISEPERKLVGAMIEGFAAFDGTAKFAD